MKKKEKQWILRNVLTQMEELEEEEGLEDVEDEVIKIHLMKIMNFQKLMMKLQIKFKIKLQML